MTMDFDENAESEASPGISPGSTGGTPETTADASTVPAPEGPVHDLAERVQRGAARALVGLSGPVGLCLEAVLAGGHVLIEGPPGVAKTLLVRTLARTLGGTFSRVQFTPDLMPADVTGTSVFHPGEGSFRFQPGPVFASFLLCDEINRSPAKTQSALLEAMQEGFVTIDGQSHALPDPFAVFATQNPIEHEGTYPLPEAQLDRFLFRVVVGYPEPGVEESLLAEAHGRRPGASPEELGVESVTTPEELLAARAFVRSVTVRPDLFSFVVRLLGETRRSPSLALGASPRAGVLLVRAAKARAAVEGRSFLLPDDIKGVFVACLAHRVALDPAEEIEGVRSQDVLTRILDHVEVPR